MEAEEELIDRISSLPDDVIGDIISRLPSKEGGRLQVISSRWRHLWRSAPLNFNLHDGHPVPRRASAGEISRILSAHLGSGRCFSIPIRYFERKDHLVANLDGWLRSPALDGLQALEFHYGVPSPRSPRPPLPTSVYRFSRSLRVASFGGCDFPDGSYAGALYLPVLTQLSLWHVRISESSLHAWLAGCSVLQSLLLAYKTGCPRLRIMSPSLRSIGVDPGCGDLKLQKLIIEDAPNLERLLLFRDMATDISVISAPKLGMLGRLRLTDDFPRLQFGTTVFQASTDGGENLPCEDYRDLVGTLDICLKKIVLTNYQGNESHVNFAKFFVLNAGVLESMMLDLQGINVTSAWIEEQHRLLQLENRASKVAQLDFVLDAPGRPLHLRRIESTHDLSMADPFARFL
ncbi:hypothetical protein EJB05_55606 [Eragrostis curvula]|uniref:F-box domain-containing protein n=2 Tax=Eragrostis curvula TaxID=38414 RepID=A0A5J9SJ95_9POAL|nr:hypothetical protein EJB05_55606 [Eragrostis curvula]